MYPKLIGGEPDMKTYIDPLSNTFKNFGKLFCDEVGIRNENFTKFKMIYCQATTRKTCNCWGCVGVRWKLFTYEELIEATSEREEVRVYGVKF
jgi:hypothetical protein